MRADCTEQTCHKVFYSFWMHTNRNNGGLACASMPAYSSKTKEKPNKHNKKNTEGPVEMLKRGYRTILHLHLYHIGHYICGSPCFKAAELSCRMEVFSSSSCSCSNSPWCTQMVRKSSISVWNQTHFQHKVHFTSSGNKKTHSFINTTF